jgi:hypothetical protein
MCRVPPCTGVAHSQLGDVGERDLAVERQCVDGDDLLPQRGHPAGEVEGRARRNRDAVRSGVRGLGRIDEVTVDAQTGTSVALTARAQQQDLCRSVRRPAGGAEHLGGRVAREHPAPRHEDCRAGRPQREVGFEVGTGVDVGEQPLERRPAQLPPGEQPGCECR